MAIKINISGVDMERNSELLNDVKISGESSVNIEVKNSKMTENSRALNDLDAKNSQVNIELENLSLGENVDFMNNRKFTENTPNKKIGKKQFDTPKGTKKDGFFKRLFNSVLKREGKEEHTQERYAQEGKESFKAEISSGVNLDYSDTSETLYSDEMSAEKLKDEKKNTDRTK